MTFQTYLETKLNPEVTLDCTRYMAGLHEAIQKLMDFSEDQEARLINYQINMPEVDSVLHQSGYPHRDRVIQALLTKNPERVKDAWQELYKWTKGSGIEKFNIVYPASREIYDYSLHLGGYKKFTKTDAEKWERQILENTKFNMEMVAKEVRDAIRSIEWQGSKVKIMPRESFTQDSRWDEATDTAEIYVGTGPNAPYFMYFKTTEGPVIDDILEAGDVDFFDIPSEEADYFALVQKLRNPNETSSLITVYTARPPEDRDVYRNARDIPPNIFVTTDFDRAEGIASDLPSKGGSRDVWKLRIQSKYLLNTLDTGRIKDYQVIGSGVVPIKDIFLVRPGLR